MKTGFSLDRARKHLDSVSRLWKREHDRIRKDFISRKYKEWMKIKKNAAP